MSRNAARIVAFVAAGLTIILAGSCGDHEQTLVANEEQQLPSRSTPVVVDEDFVVRGESAVFIAIPKARYVSGIYDPWISGVVVSILPDAARERFVANGIAFVDDAKITSMIAIITGMESSYLSDGVWIGSSFITWSCLKCCYGEPPCCTPCLSCCDDDKDGYSKVQFEVE